MRLFLAKHSGINVIQDVESEVAKAAPLSEEARERLSGLKDKMQEIVNEVTGNQPNAARGNSPDSPSSQPMLIENHLVFHVCLAGRRKTLINAYYYLDS